MPLVILEETLQKELDATRSDDPKRLELREKIEIVKEIREKIRPINAQRYAKKASARSNCVYVAEECVKVLNGTVGRAHKVPLRRENLPITVRKDNNNNIVYHEVLSKNQADLVGFQDFTEIISLLDDQKPSTKIDLSLVSSREIAKYIQSNLNNLAFDLKNIPGTADSNGDDKTLTGLIYYYYENIDAGHLANFYRSKQGYLFFVDAQSEEITESPPEKIFNNNIKKNSIFYFLAKPKFGYYVKKEHNTAVNAMIKKEPEDAHMMIFTTTTTQSTNDNSELNPLNSNETASIYQSQQSSFSSNSTRFWNEVPGHDENNNNISETRTIQITSGYNISSSISNLKAEMQQLDQDLEALKNISTFEDAFKLYPLFPKFINFLDKLLNLSSSADILKALKLHLVTAKFVKLGATLADQKKWLGSDFYQRSKDVTEKIFKLNSKIIDENSYISPTLEIQLSSINLFGLYLDHWTLKNCTLKIYSNYMHITCNTKFCGKNIFPRLDKKTLDALLMIANLKIYYKQANNFMDVSTGNTVSLKEIDQKAKENGVVICSNNSKELKLSYSPHGIYKRIHSANQKVLNSEKQTEELKGKNKKLEAENAKLKMELETLRNKQSRDQNSSEDELDNNHHDKRVRVDP